MTLLIVDDEMIICNWLSMLIMRAGVDDLTVDSVNSAEEAIKYCDRNPVNLLITDITMPGKNGIELLQELSVTHPEIKTAVLSSYDDFGYVRQALKIGALDYVLKSDLTEEDIVSLLKKAELSASLRTDIGHYQPENQNLLRRFRTDNGDFRDMLDEIITEEDFYSIIGFNNTGQDLGLAAMRLVRKDKSEDESGIIAEVISKTLGGSNLEGRFFILQNKYLMILIRFATNIREHQESILDKLAVISRHNIIEYTGYDAIKPCCTVLKKNESLKKKVESILNNVNAKLYYNAHSDTVLNQLKPEDGILLNNRIQRSLNAMKFEEAFACIRQFAQECHQNMIFPDEIKRTVIYEFTILNAAMNEFRNDKIDIIDFNNSISGLLSADSETALMEQIDEFIEKSLEKSDISEDSIAPAVKKTMEYIQDHYMERISLDDISKYTFLNKSYLSQLFSQQMNLSIGAYIENVRMKKAMELLRDSKKTIAEVAEESGYSTQSYFTKVFSKRTGMTPKNYRIMSYK